MSKLDRIIKKTELFAKLATYGSRGVFLQALGQIPPQAWTNREDEQARGVDALGNPLNTGIPPAPPDQGNEVETPYIPGAPPENPAGQVKTLPTVQITGYVPIDPAFQRLLGVFPDGQLGDKTRAALDKYKQTKNPGMTDALAFEYLKKEPGYSPTQPLPAAVPGKRTAPPSPVYQQVLNRTQPAPDLSGAAKQEAERAKNLGRPPGT